MSTNPSATSEDAIVEYIKKKYKAQHEAAQSVHQQVIVLRLLSHTGACISWSYIYPIIVPVNDVGKAHTYFSEQELDIHRVPCSPGIFSVSQGASCSWACQSAVPEQHFTGCCIR